jgi:hypothetical protein
MSPRHEIHIRSLPEADILPGEPPDPATRGWWLDPFETVITQQRFHDGERWTPYVVYLRGRIWSEVVEYPIPDDLPSE